MLQLIQLDKSHEKQWESFINEWELSDKIPKYFDQVYEKFLLTLKKLSLGDDLENNFPQSLIFFLQDSSIERIIGFFWFKYNLIFNDDYKFSGNIAYGIRLSDRGKGYAKTGLALLLKEVEKLGYHQVTVACHVDNMASYRIIEANNGKLQEIVNMDNGEVRRRYLINL